MRTMLHPKASLSHLCPLLLVAITSGALSLGCGRREELESCDINQQACQESVYYAVMRARGDGFDPFDGVPPIRTITKKEYEKELFPNGLPKPPPPDENVEDE